MYNRFRNEVVMALGGMDKDTLNTVLMAMDKAAAHYTFAQQTMELAVDGRKQMMDLIRLYLVVKKIEGQSDSTQSIYMSVLRRFVLDCNVPLRQLTANHVRSWLYNYQQARKITMRTLDLYRIAVCSFLKWCAIEGYLKADITLTINKIKYVKERKNALTQLQLEKVRHACETKRESCIVQVLYSTGCRVSELVNIKLSDIDWANNQITVLGKGNKKRSVYINAKAEYAIRSYINSRNVISEYLIAGERHEQSVKKDTIERIFRDFAKRTGIEQRKLTPHVMRHTMATQAATVCPIQQVQRMLGHSSINTTMIYADVNDDSVRAGHELAVI